MGAEKPGDNTTRTLGPRIALPVTDASWGQKEKGTKEELLGGRGSFVADRKPGCQHETLLFKRGGFCLGEMKRREG